MHKINILFNAILGGGAMETLHTVPLDEIVKAIGQAVIAIVTLLYLLRRKPKE
jgi:hypothetical protein